MKLNLKFGLLRVEKKLRSADWAVLNSQFRRLLDVNIVKIKLLLSPEGNVASRSKGRQKLKTYD